MYFGDDVLADDSIKNYIDLYNFRTDKTGLSLKDIEPLKNENFKIFSLANTDIRIIDRDECYKKLIPLSQLRFFMNDHNEKVFKNYKEVKGNKLFYMIPVQTIKGTIVNFIFRRVFDKKGLPKNKRYHSIKIKRDNVDKIITYPYGWYKDFETFEKDSSVRSKPIVICEGVKDCIYLKQFYPYVLTMNGSQIGFYAYILRNLTNKLVFVSDTDDVGLQGFKYDRYTLRKLGFVLTKVNLDYGIKDAATYIKYPELKDSFERRLLRTIRELEDSF